MNKRAQRLLALIMAFVIVFPMFGNIRSVSAEETKGDTIVGDAVKTNFEDGDLSLGTHNIDENWKFHLGDQSNAQSKAFDDSKWEDINVPHDYSLKTKYTQSGEAESGYKIGGIAWYRKNLEVSSELSGKRFVLNFDGVYMHSTVYVNGHKVGTHPYGYTPFSFDITKYIVPGETNVLAVKVDQQFPSSRWYSGSGIFRSVNLEVQNKLHIKEYGVSITTPKIEEQLGKNVDTNIKTSIKNDSKDNKEVIIKNEVFDKDKSVVSVESEKQTVNAGAEAVIESNLTVNEAKTWSLENPNLYKVETSLIVNGEVVDKKTNDIGFRTIKMDPNKGFFLNGKSMKLQGVSMHHDNGALGAAEYYRAVERKVEILKGMGVNAIRVTHNPASQILIDIANEKGVLVIDEIFDTWVSAKNGNYNDFAKWFNVNIESGNEILRDKETMTWAEYDTKQMVKRGQNAPSIIMWSTGNEVMEGNSGPYTNYPDILSKIAGWIQEIDKERLVTIGDNKFKENWGESKQFGDRLTKLGGAVGMNYSNGQHYDTYHSANPTWSIYGSETASAINSRGIYKRVDTDKLYTSYDIKTVPWGQVAAQSWLQIAERDFVAGEFVWTGFDYLGEPTNFNKTNPGAHITGWPSPKSSYFGIVDTAGLPKDRYYFYKSQWDKENTTLHILPAWHKDLVSKDISGNVIVNVYSNAKAVELFFKENGSDKETSLGKKEFTEKTTQNGYKYQLYTGEGKSSKEYENLYLKWEVPYKDGTLRAVAYDKDNKVIENTVGRNTVTTYGDAKKLELTADRQTIEADGKDLSYITIDVKDEKGNIVDGANNLVKVEVKGNGKLLGLDNGDQRDHEPYESGQRKALSGKLVAIVQSTKSAGDFTVTASSEGLTNGTVTVKTTAENKDVAEGPVAYTMPKIYYVKAGTVAQLQDKATLHYADKEDKEVSVKWAAVDTTKTGVQTVLGTIADENKTVKATVVVLDADSILLNYSTAVLVGSGKVQLPQDRPIVDKTGKILDANFPVKWQEQDENQYKQKGVYTVKGTADIFGKQVEVTASIRVTEANAELSTNIAPNNTRLEQDIPKELESDSLEAIVDGSYEPKSVGEGQPNPSVWTNYNNAQKGDKDAVITFTYATAQVFSKAKLGFYEDSWSARIPSKVEIQYSADGETDWKTLEYKQVAGEKKAYGATSVTPYEYTFSPVSATAIRFVITSPTGKNASGRAELCTGLTELELFTSTSKFEMNKSALLDELKVNGTDVKGDLKVTKTFKSDQEKLDVTAKSNENASITILPQLDNKVIVLTESEDNNTRDKYTVYSKDYNFDGTVENADQYKIYPKPQELKYLEGGIRIGEEINLVLSDKLDQYTKNKVDKILKENNLSKSISNEIDSTKVNLLVGIKGSGDAADKFFEKEAIDAEHFNKTDAYRLSIKDSVIAVLGKDTDSAFYGLTTLQHILAQAKDGVVRKLTINDFSSQEIRGVIEGYYGVPWTWERRQDLLKFGAEFKNNVMIFAPKDDPYHRDKWRDLYPQEELDKISELAKIGNEEKNRFVWTIAPFHKEAINDANYDESIKILIKKFDQLYDAGVRQFGVLRDDISSEYGYQTVSRVMNDLSKWAKTKDEKIYDFLFCPYSYTLEGWAWRAAELNEYTKNFPEDVKIFFTGENVCSPIKTSANEAFMTRGISGQRRPEPLIWLNWPVNDVFKSSHGFMALVMGNPKMILDPTVENMVGVVTNPMQESYASFVSVFAIADYTWNTKSYNADVSYADGFEFIDPNASKELKELASHMASANGTIGIQNLPESEQMKAEIAEFEKVMTTRDVEVIREKGEALKAKYDTIIKAVDGFNDKSKFAGLKEDLSTYILVLKEKSQAAKLYIDAIITAKEKGKDAAIAKYEEAEKLFEQSRSHKVTVSPTGERRRADAGIARINPNIQNMRILLNEIIEGDGEEADTLKGDNIALNEGKKLPLAIASWTNDGSPSTDTIKSINDGVKDFDGGLGNRWTNWRPTKRANDWVGIVFGKDATPEKMKVAGIKLGFFEDHGTSYPETYKVQYYDGPEFTAPENPGHINDSNSPLKDDANWKDVKNLKGTNFRLKTMNTLSFDDVETYAIRVKMNPKANMGLAITEFEAYGEKIVKGPFDNSYITEDMIFAHPSINDKVWQTYTKANMIDANDDTFTWWHINNDITRKGDYIGLDLKQVMKLGRFRMVIGGNPNGADHYDKYVIRYSDDKVNWKTLGEEITQTTPKQVVDTNFEGITARYIIVENLQDKPNWIQISEFMVETTEIDQPEEPGDKEVDKTKLKALLDKANAVDKASYTPESVASLEEAIKSAQAVYDKETATNREVSSEVAKLEKAIKGLVEKSENVFYPGLGDSKFYRIPSIVKTEKETLVSAADMRNQSILDWNDIDIAVRRREKGAEEFGELIKVIDLADKEQLKESAFTMDPSMLVSDGKIFMLVDMFPASTGLGDNDNVNKETAGTGYYEKDGKHYLELTSAEGVKYYADEKGDVYVKADDTKSNYTVVLTSEKQPFSDLGDLYKDGQKIGNIYLKDAELKIKKTAYLWLTVSEDDGKTWSSPVDLTPQVKADWMKFIGTGPGTGLKLQNGRLVFPIYFTNGFRQLSSALIYSDDNGETWNRGESPNDGRKYGNEVLQAISIDTTAKQLTESQVIQLQNGDLKLFMRNVADGNPKQILIATSHDNGNTWEDTIERNGYESNSWCQMSVISFVRDGKEYVMTSQPIVPGTWSRYKGTVKLGVVNPEDSSIEWIGEKLIELGAFQYSVLVNLGNDKFGILYENGTDSITIKYKEFDIKDLLEEPEKPEDGRRNIAIKKSGNKYPVAIASWTNDQGVSSDRLTAINDEIISYNNDPQNRWTNWSRERKSNDWVGYIFGDKEVKEEIVDELNIAFYKDGSTDATKEISVEYYVGPDFTDPKTLSRVSEEKDHPFNNPENWRAVQNLKYEKDGEEIPAGKETTFTFDAVKTKAIRVNLVRKDGKFGVGITELQVFANTTELPVNKDNLKSAIDKATKADLTNKTEETAQALTKALENAKLVLEDKDATQEQVDKAEKAVLDAIANLKDKEEPETPETPDKKYKWVKNGRNWNYYEKDGTKVLSKWKWTPILDKDGKETGSYNWKYFDSKGNSITQIYTENGNSWLSLAGPTDKYYRGWWTNPENDSVYFFRITSGSMVRGRQFINGHWMYFRNAGTVATGWQWIDGAWTFFDKRSGYQAISQWKWAPLLDKDGKETSKKNAKYFNSKGQSITQIYSENGSSWLSQAGPSTQYYRGWWTNPENGYRYFFRLSSATMVKGEQFIDGKWRFFRSSGTMATGWQKVGITWKFYRIGTGTRVSGKQWIDGRWYEFAKDGSLIK
ncbi:beta-N-acetylglucosaminidase domain-containing protein [Helcococcus kunzii]|uniref:beta-N-acetylglucosaminidase domain-containing protein n=1 Tax=Helcococcus kunzii TaxID=40091 RepID=UPI001C986448|nr:beta-N-acetylglucosaminidase domain-containing protein [Helcococcus kunzii]QZO76160.1 beta-N-acetylglucosaminidase domain-containing protein [Helcococcus kunzii]